MGDRELTAMQKREAGVVASTRRSIMACRDLGSRLEQQIQRYQTALDDSVRRRVAGAVVRASVFKAVLRIVDQPIDDATMYEPG